LGEGVDALAGSLDTGFEAVGEREELVDPDDDLCCSSMVGRSK
jgi:hypothetical protein